MVALVRVAKTAALFSALLCLARAFETHCHNLSPENRARYTTEALEDFNIVCPPGYALYRVESCWDSFTPPEDDRKKRNLPSDYDREWLWECRVVTTLREEDCFWSPDLQPVDNLEEPILYQCPKNYYMAGVRSLHMNGPRLWRVRCCAVEDWCSRDCCLSDFTSSEFGELISHTAPDGKFVFVGLFSERNIENSDRRWKIEQCKFSLCDLDVIIDAKNEDLSQ